MACLLCVSEGVSEGVSVGDHHDSFPVNSFKVVLGT